MEHLQVVLDKSCMVCRHRHENCQGMPSHGQGQACEKFENYGEFLARELAFVDRQFVLHQIAGMGAAISLGFGMTWVLGHLA